MPAPEQALYSGYYTTITAWESACPANLVSVDQIWEGHLYPDGGGTNGEWILSALLTIATTTVDATRFMRLRAAAGHAFYDHGNKLTNALRYNTANGVAVRANYGYGTGAIRQGERSQLVGLQVSYERSALYNDSGANWLTDRCILSGGQSNQPIVRIATGTNAIVSNSLIISRGDRDGVYTVGAGATFKNCTFIKPTGVAASVISSGGYGGVSTFQNCAIFGFNAPTTGFSGSSSYNATNLSSLGGSNNQVSQTFADQFENISSVAALDARLKSTNTIEGDGSSALLYGAYDILGQGWNTTPSLGAFEGDVAAAGGHDVEAANASSQPTAATAAIAQTHRVGVTNATSAPSASAAAIQQTHRVTAAAATSTPGASTAAIAQGAVHQVTATNATSTPAASAATVTQTHRVTTSNATSAPTATTAAIRQTHAVTAAGATSTPSASAASVGQGSLHLVTASNAQSQPTASNATIAQTHQTQAANATSQPTASAAGFSQGAVHLIGAANATSNATASTAAIQQTHRVGAVAASIPASASGAAVAQIHLIGAAHATSAPTASGGEATTGEVVAGYDILRGHGPFRPKAAQTGPFRTKAAQTGIIDLEIHP
jgi:hypothetical protein